MSYSIEVFLPGNPGPVDLDGLASHLATVAAAGTPMQQRALPDEVYYNNPSMETELSITLGDEQ
jgi:hypothetical protein